jgi:5-methylcytosine-specific restriction protein A
MASKPRKYCAEYPCSALAAPGSSYCDDHRPPAAPKATDPFYLRPAWRRFRNWYLANHPMCALCGGYGDAVPAVIVDHVVELKDGGAPYDEGNVQALCLSCHNKKTADEKMKRNMRKIIINH